MKNLKQLIVVTGILFSGIVNAQQTQNSSLYNYNPILINPAETGYKNTTDIGLNYRMQWTNYTGAPSTGWLAGHTQIKEKMGIGGVVLYDEMAFIKNIDAKLYYAYHLKLAADFKLSFGLGLGVIQNSINFSDIKADDYTDEIISGGNVSGTMFDANFGTVINFKEFKLGISLPQIFQGKVAIPTSNIEANYNLKSHLNIYGSYDYEINNQVTFLPSVMYRRSKASSQFDIFANFMFNKQIFLGLGFRQGVGIMANVGVKLKEKIQLNYAYEFGKSGFASATSGTHEIMLKFVLGKSSVVEEELEKTPDIKVNNKF
jgi:type IX secretion system PorP/SprF family membrane protein